ncbi:kinase-like protein [Xylariaceae sp. FL0804]|nr:kinase-like protein [Xylariaceae sp. FL0804]
MVMVGHDQRIPDPIPPGYIYQQHKGKSISHGLTGWVDLLDSGAIIKYPAWHIDSHPLENENKYYCMRVEEEAYRRLSGSSVTPRLLDWDPESCELTLEYMSNGRIFEYIKEHNPSPELRDLWVTTLIDSLVKIHDVGIIHSDFTPQNILLAEDLGVRVADFAGSSLDGRTAEVCASARYISPHNEFKAPKPTDDVFSLGSVMYLIITGMEPYPDVKDDEEVETLFRNCRYPDTEGLPFGSVIKACWDGTCTTAAEVKKLADTMVRTSHPS